MSYRIAIVEDNPLVVHSLSETIDWTSLDCEIIGVAYDGKNGYDLIIEKKPDIVLTDVCMPQCNGLDMIEMIRKELPDCIVIIITGYDYFQYAKRAINLAVFDYLLKPINNNDVIRSVLQAIEAVKAKHATNEAIGLLLSSRQRALLLSLLSSPSKPGLGVHDMLVETELDFRSYYMIALQTGNEQSIPQAYLNHLESILSECKQRILSMLVNNILVLFVYHAEELVESEWKSECRKLLHLIRDELPEDIRIGVSQPNTSIHSIHKSYQQAQQALRESILFYDDGATVYFGEETRRESANTNKQALKEAINKLVESADLSEKNARRAAQELVKMTEGQPGRLRAIITMYALAFCNKFHDQITWKTQEAFLDTWSLSNETDACEYLINLSTSFKTHHEESTYSLLVRSAIEYLDIHAVENLSLGDIADKLCVSRNYLSAIIHKETGITFHEWQQKAKMNIAKNMLSDPRIRISEIADTLGYSSYSSFYNAFKAYEHISPTDFRNGRGSK